VTGARGGKRAHKREVRLKRITREEKFTQAGSLSFAESADTAMELIQGVRLRPNERPVDGEA
jgi:hypothetical protein